MKRMIRTLGIFLMLLAGCSPSFIQKSPQLSFARLQDWPAVYRANFTAIHSLQSRVQISVESPEVNARFSAQFIYAAPDTLFLQAEGPLGLDIGQIFIGKNRFILYNQYNNQFISGLLDDQYYSRFLQTDFSFRELKDVLLGFVRLPENLKLVDEKHGVFTAPVSEGKMRVLVNPQTGLLQKKEVYRGDEVVLQEEFKYYRRVGRVVVPGMIRAVLPQKTQMISVRHTHIDVNKALDPARYRIEINPKVQQLIIDGR